MSDARSGLISVVLCTTGERSTLSDCLASLRVLDDPRHEVIVVENAPTPKLTVGDLAGWEARLVLEPRRGLNAARNRGVSEARGPIVAFVDDDCVVDRRWLSGFREAFEDPAVDFATGRTQARSLTRRSEQCFEGLFGFDRGDEARSFDWRTPGAWLQVVPGEIGSGCNMAFRRSVLDTVGPFDEALEMGTAIGGGGDLDMFGRLLRAGARARYVPSAYAQHQHRRTMRELTWQVWGYGVAQGALVSKVSWQEPRFRRMAWSFWRNRARDAARRIVTSILWPRVLPTYLNVVELAGIVVGLIAYPVAVGQRRQAARGAGEPGTILENDARSVAGRAV